MYNTMMKSKWRKEALFIFIFISRFYNSNGCWMEDIDSWFFPEETRILDIHRGIIFDRVTRDIINIVSHDFSDELNGGPYFTVSHTDSRFVIATNDAFENYERYETFVSPSIDVTFRCSDGTTNSLVFIIGIQDTNNHSPEFLESNKLAYNIMTPLAPGVLITGCSEGITVRDIDLTTSRIDFTIEENSYFEIEYDNDLSTTAKEFTAILRTTAFIRSLSEPMVLEITATDVDGTGDPRRNTTTTITISANTEFELPEELVFTKAFYLANYTDDDDNQLVLLQPISLQSGFDNLVQFSLEKTDFSDYFEPIPNGNQVSIRVIDLLPPNVLRENQIVLVVRADREYTSGASATIIVQLPEEVPLEFAKLHYEGTIDNNNLTLPELTLSRGYEGETVNVEVFGEYESYFDANIDANTITLSMEQLAESIINENNVISLEVVASTEFSYARAVVTLEIIKDDNVTPVFNKAIYTGSYHTETGLTIDKIELDQGYDDTVELVLEGDEFTLFTTTREGPIVTLSVTNIPSDLFYLQRIRLILQATKPRTVGANAVIDIALPAARELGFEENTYRGTFKDNILSLEPIILSTGYDETVVFSIRGDLREYFNLTFEQNKMELNLMTSIPTNIIQENNIIVLNIEASGPHAVMTTTTILLDILKEDITTPMFTHNIYYGIYQGASRFNIETIHLAQGFSDDVVFELRGEHAEYFNISNTDNNVEVSLRATTIPEDVIFTEKVLLFNIIAIKPLTVGANAAISIRFPSELTDPVVMRFAENTYEAAIENNKLTVDDIILIAGFAPGTQFLLTEGDFSTYFNVTNTNNVVSLSLIDTLPIDEIESTFIVLDLEARRETAVSVWTSIVIDIVRQEIEPLVFTHPYYRGVYSEETETLSFEMISLALGFDDTVDFYLEGDFAPWFNLTGTANTLSVATNGALSSDVLEKNSHLMLAIVASKPNAIEARAAILINIEKQFSADPILSFDKVTYVGSIENTTLALETITLIKGYSETVTFSLHGALNSFFNASSQGNGAVSVTLTTPIPNDLLPSNRIIVLEIRARADETHPAHATIVLEVIVEDEQSSAPRLEFDASFYTGSYTTAETGITMDRPIILAEGFDESVTFDVEGDQSEWFTAVGTGNSVSLIVSTTIPGGILVGNQPLVFVVTADRPGSDTARATIVISLTDEFSADHILSFDKVTYVGSIENTTLALETITLIEGYSETVTFSLHGALNSFFNASSQGNGAVSVTLTTPIPNDLLPSNRIIVLEIRARADETHPAHATIVLEVIVEDEQSSAPRLEFDASFYTGSYTTAETGITMDRPIILAEGFDESVTFDVEGDQSEWFTAVGTGNSVSLVVSTTIPGGVLVGNQPLVFVVTADRPGSDTARATIVISLTDEFSADPILSFDKVTYIGSIENTSLALETITLIKGYSETVTFSLHGTLNSFFNASSQGNGAVSVTLTTPIPNDLLPSNRIIVLEIRARADETHPAHATIVLEVIVEDEQSSAPRLEFDASFYTGSYTTAGTGITMDRPIILAEGFDESVTFDVEGDQSEWFTAVGTGNSVSLIVSTTIPGGILVGNQPLVFVVTADRPGSDTARATIVISLTDEFSADHILSFDKVTYVGSIENTTLALETITLIEGYSETVTFSLHGALNSFFNASSQGNGAVSVTLTTPIPNDLLPSNRIIVLEIRARADETHPAHATIVLEVIVEDEQSSAPRLEFDASFYTGSYTTAGTGITMDRPIILAEGFDESVTFDVEGDQSEWFTAVGTGNSVSLIVSTTIPGGILVGNQPLVFVVTADRPGSDTARATIVISLTDEFSADHILSFDKVTYVGSIENTTLALETITLIEGYSETVTFSLHGALNSFFNASSQGNGAVSVTLTTPIPNDLLPSNRIIVLEIRARADETHPAHATIVLEVIVEDEQSSAPRLEFDASFYTGSYTTAETGITMDRPIILAEGFDESVTFDVEGDQSEWFTAVGTGNSVSLVVSTTIPGGVLVGNQPLVFVVTADRPGSDTARATIVISLTDEFSADPILSFDKVTYIGSIENTSLALETITLIKGYSETVTFSLHGALNSFFNASSQGNGAVSVTLTTPIPNDLLPSNRIIVLEIRARADETHPAHATIVLEVIVEDEQSSAPRLEFDASFYTGSYTTAGTGITMDRPIILAEGFDESVTFDVEGDQSEWFTAVGTGNSVSLIVSTTIPGGILVGNQPLVFVVTADRPGSDTARATIVISLTDEFSADHILSFDKVTYVGSIENTTLALETITLIEGYSETVTFSLHGALNSFFNASSQGNGAVSVTLTTPIPNDLLPSNRIIVLEIRARADETHPAHATIVLEVIVEDEQSSAPRLEFDASFYTGSYTTAGTGITMDRPIILAEGFDESVTFDVEGDQSEWFTAVGTGNSVSLIVSTTIPGGILVGNQPLVFVVTADRPGSDTARATIVISLTDEFSADHILSFDKVTYVGSIENTTLALETITLIEGYSETVTFSLHGALNSFFNASSQGNGAVSVTLTTPIPNDLLPSNRIIVLEIRARADETHPAHATIVLEVIVEDEQSSAPRLEFDASFYTGSYTTAETGITMDRPIILAEGFDESVTFDVEGDQSEWFTAVGTGNSVSLIVSTTIPGGILVGNQPLVFVVTADRPGSDTARATIVISLTDEFSADHILSFDKVTYVGSIENTTLALETITLIKGYSETVTFSLHGALNSFFNASSQGNGAVSVTLTTPIPNDLLPSNRIIVLEIRARADETHPAHATIVLEVIVEDEQSSAPRLEFDASFYTGSYTTAGTGIKMDRPIILAEGFDESVTFDVEGDQSEWFTAVGTGNSVSLIVSTTIPGGILVGNQPLVFVVTADRPGSDTARATIVISLTDEFSADHILSFDKVTYVGSIENTTLALETITLIEGYSETVTFSLHGALNSFFNASSQGNGAVSVTLTTPIPNDLLPSNRIIVLEIRARADETHPAHATIVLEVIVEDEQSSAPRLEFDASFYTGSYTTAETGITMDRPIILAEGFDESVTFDVEGDQSEWFTAVGTGNSVSLVVSTTIPGGVLVGNQPLVFVVTADRPGSDTARATIVISLTDEFSADPILSFDKVTYIGSIENTSLALETITLIEGYSETVTFSLHGALNSFFNASSQGNGAVSVTLTTPIPNNLLPSNRIIVLEIRARADETHPAHATIVLEVIVEDEHSSTPRLVFDASFYTGSYTTAEAGITLDRPIILAEGFDESVTFDVEGDQSEWFTAVGTGNSVSLVVSTTIPGGVLVGNQPLVFVVTADRPGSDTARATVVISLENNLQPGDDVSFEKLVYEGIIQLNTVQHELIIIFNYDGVIVNAHGVFSDLFVTRVADGVVTVQASGSLTLPGDVTTVVLELHAADARSVLLLTVEASDVPVMPAVTFSSPSYVLNVEIVQTGLVGRVSATADNGEAVSYSLAIENAHLQARISINNEGELYLSAPANSGIYTFQVIASTVITQAEGRAQVHLTVNAVTVCGDEIVVPPLIILDRNEEEPHNNLVTLSQFENCHFSLTNRWPLNQNWLYVDENGLHARTIDREHESIAYMAQSQVQVELILHCENDNVSRTKRSERTDWLGPYDYGSNQWILTESISYNSRRSFVNLIVNDINDNIPIFVGKEREPIAVGYPIGEIEDRILPRSLAELQATDADVGENAALRYWSSEEVLAVAPSTGFVHVRNSAQLENDQSLIISATDQNGQGLTGHIQLVVKLLDFDNIVVVTVRDAFQHDETTILAQLSEAVGYEMKALKSIVISDNLDRDDDDDDISRKKRETGTSGASLLLYVYGLLQREPVSVDRLTVDINNAAVVSVISTVSLEDHLEPVEIIISESNIGLLVATIVLSVLLFITLVLIAVWFFLRWRKNNNYKAFSDISSLASRTESEEQIPNTETPKPRLNFEELKRSERRLQNMLNAPIEEVTVEAVSPRREIPVESIVDLLSPESNVPIVIQSIDKLKSSDDSDDDEFGEKPAVRRKSVVTFNENVEKIIHVEDDDADTVSSVSSYETYKF